MDSISKKYSIWTRVPSKFLLGMSHVAYMYISGMVTRFVISLINFRIISYIRRGS